MRLKAVILAAGKGTRFKSEKPKVLHKILGKPMIFYVKSAVEWVNPEEIIFIVGHKKDEVIKEINCDSCKFVEQKHQLGTGHAVIQAIKYFKDFDGYILIINGDTPLIKGETLKEAINYLQALINYEGRNIKDKNYQNKEIAGLILTATVENPYGYGRIVKEKAGVVEKIVEEKDASFTEKQIKEVNSGIYIVYAPYLKEALEKLNNNNAQKEYYLTDIVKILKEEDKKFYTFNVGDPTQILGVNDRWQLSQAENILKNQFIYFWALNGTTFHNPETIYIEFDATFGKDIEIFQGCSIKGNTEIDDGTIIYENCVIKNCKIGKNVKIYPNTVIEDSIIEDNAEIGPFARIRNNTVIGKNVSIGNFVEIKNSTVGENTTAKHLTYLGDAEIGKNVNIGAGTITCNYDGVKKHKTVIKDNAFIGSDTMLVAPIIIGENAYTGSGSVITKDVPDNALAVERTPLKIIENYSKRKKNKDEQSC
ncbi:bifunctional UDP-N-acetylglucosamine diphosphorylase/glucosamine-1-phosphate N-acetyltransferase GlmU [Hydrogenothermus marinus]|uniref:Bifunctional protein GlmU n=1 Tax=Hydrogenothermus marinus TaxID=133270 RepID=A0A3M0BZL7_9AQUI|nr:bifunctional UDP-N-acetylglucosamine diphosphorylase/glucosamine-1-phosphate N-acetyltransferase GlmU [Hydrogenothermus marinus]RMA96122.1 UDP-N-acetylglucosamine pyrophosphorylase /glucosamine-1-phosphate N-acetyltransferase [Hydrogenothermus marinus]